MDTLLRRKVGIIDTAALGACALLMADAASTAIAGRLAASSSHVERVPPARAARAVATEKRIDAIVARALFVVDGAPGRVAGAGEAAAALPLELLAIMFAPAPADARWSMAVVRDRAANAAGAFAVGARVRGATVVEIEETRVHIALADGRRQVLALLAPAAAPTVAARPPSTGITRVGEHAWQLRRSAVEAYLGDVGALAARRRAVLEMRDGRPAGLRLFGIRPADPLALIGLANGDVVAAIDGIALTSPDAALRAYTALRTASRFSVAVERAGRRLTLEYVIAD